MFIYCLKSITKKADPSDIRSDVISHIISQITPEKFGNIVTIVEKYLPDEDRLEWHSMYETEKCKHFLSIIPNIIYHQLSMIEEGSETLTNDLSGENSHQHRAVSISS